MALIGGAGEPVETEVEEWVSKVEGHNTDKTCFARSIIIKTTWLIVTWFTKRSYTCNYKYLEIKYYVSWEWIELLACNSPLNRDFLQKCHFETFIHYKKHFIDWYTTIHRYIDVSILNLQYWYTHWNIMHHNVLMHHSIIPSLILRNWYPCTN